ncbi:NAD(P)H-dependent oxidoreductase [Chryseobacterium sp. SIMBA_028]|uniref:NAD(P)H-dependent oxidoreductase n=1 Tax=Chryseobacterium sp. SIMBA_028 TaxID=3085771 RepID=UPI00397CA036
MMSLEEALNWRSATKSYNGRIIEKDKIEQILNAIRLAPSSSGLQPFKVFVITNKELREKLQPIAWQQQQIVQASHILVFAAWDEYTAERVDAFFEFSNKERNLPSTATDDYRLNLLEMLDKKTKEDHFVNASQQTYIALGFGLLAAAHLKIDATPLEGFDNKGVDELLNLPQQGVRSTVMMALGYKDEDNDWWAKLKKIRRSHEELFIELN